MARLERLRLARRAQSDPRAELAGAPTFLPRHLFSSRAALALSVLILTGCGSPGAYQRSTSPPNPAESKADTKGLAELAEAVDAFDARSDKTPRALGAILRNMGSALEPVAGRRAADVQRIARRISNETETSVASSLKEALRVIAEPIGLKSGSSERRADYERALRALARATDALKELVPLAEQASATGAALRAATDVVFLVSGRDSPFGEAAEPPPMAGPPPDPIPLPAALAQARDALTELSKSRMDSRAGSSRALVALASVVAAADSKKELTQFTSEIRFQAERLRRTDAGVFEHAGWVRAALESALDALAELAAGSGRQKCTAVWLQAARNATANIDDDGSLAFQRSALQDALRASVDAYAAVTESSSCVDTSGALNPQAR